MLFGRDPVWVTSPPASNGECNLKGFPNIERGESTPGASPIGEAMMSSCSRGRLSVRDRKAEDNWNLGKQVFWSQTASLQLLTNLEHLPSESVSVDPKECWYLCTKPALCCDGVLDLKFILTLTLLRQRSDHDVSHSCSRYGEGLPCQCVLYPAPLSSQALSLRNQDAGPRSRNDKEIIILFVSALCPTRRLSKRKRFKPPMMAPAKTQIFIKQLRHVYLSPRFHITNHDSQVTSGRRPRASSPPPPCPHV